MITREIFLVPGKWDEPEELFARETFLVPGKRDEPEEPCGAAEIVARELNTIFADAEFQYVIYDLRVLRTTSKPTSEIHAIIEIDLNCFLAPAAAFIFQKLFRKISDPSLTFVALCPSDIKCQITITWRKPA